VVACRHPRLRVACPLGVDDVASVTVLGLPARVKNPLLDRRAPLVGGSLTMPPACTDVSGPCAPPSSRVFPCWQMRDAELSACCTAACSMSACASRCRFRASGVEGAGMARSSVAAATSFRLARGGVLGLLTSKSVLMHSQACFPSSRARSPRAEASPAMEACSSRTARYSSASLASSSRAWATCALMSAPLGGEGGGGVLGPAPWCGSVPGPGGTSPSPASAALAAFAWSLRARRSNPTRVRSSRRWSCRSSRTSSPRRRGTAGTSPGLAFCVPVRSGRWKFAGRAVV
jgi:hypothetical protein